MNCDKLLTIIFRKGSVTMEIKDLFAIEAQGYSCEEVEKYINNLKAEYKKVYDQATKIMGDNEKLKKICRSLKAENDSLKAGK